ncbi:hypothetical protein WH47_08055, partial [Habropoda laboriosa]
FPEKWIGRGMKVCWPAHSPDLTHLGLFLRGMIKDIVYREVPAIAENMEGHVSNACASISSDTVQRARWMFILRLNKCI